MQFTGSHHDVMEDEALKPKLDVGVYSLSPDEERFYQQQTGIQDKEELKKHIISVQAKAYEVYGYPCIRRFSFLRLKLDRLPGYHHALTLLKDRKDALFLDMGCFFGIDVRKASADGWPARNIIASDIHAAFWGYGLDFFRDKAGTTPITFIPANVFDQNRIPPPYRPYASEAEVPGLQGDPDARPFTSFKPLVGRISAIHTSALFHLFSEARQLQLAKILSSLLSPQPGSVIFGKHVGGPRMGMSRIYFLGATTTGDMFCHSPESWVKMWEDVFSVIGEGKVKVEAALAREERWDISKRVGIDDDGNELEPLDEDDRRGNYVIHWSVTRL